MLDVMDLAEDKIVEDPRVVRLFGKDVLIGETLGMYSSPILFEKKADEDIQITVQLQGDRAAGTAQIFAYKYDKNNPMHKTEKDRLIVYKILVSDGYDELYVVNIDPDETMEASESITSSGESKPRKTVIDIKGKYVK